MEFVDNITSTLKKPDVAGLIAFLASAVLIWLLRNSIASFVLGVDPSSFMSVEGQYIYAQASITVNGLLIAIIGFLIYVTIIRDVSVERSRFSALAQDINQDVSLTREQFQALYENSPVPYFLMDDTGMIRHPNKATLRFFGGMVDACERVNMYDALTTGDHLQRAGPALFREKIERGIPISQEEMHIRTLSGEYRWVLLSIHSFLHDTSIPLHHLVTLVDITQEKESERAKSDFLLLASHQLRTPMTTIKWYIDYLLHTQSIILPTDVRNYLEEIDVGNQRMIDLVGTLLTVSQIEMGTLVPESTPVSVNEVIEDVLRELTPDIKSRGTQLVFDQRGDDIIKTDRNMLRITIHNLLTNAIKYTKRGGTVGIATDYGSMMATVTVSDDGCGIPLQEQSKIFSRMFRASNARKVSSNGTGLGLHLTRSVIQKLGGSVSFVSEEGKGTTFTLSIPRIAPDA
jgi:PAS domain S-box-containing protein